MPGEPLVDLRAIGLSRGPTPILRNVDLTLVPGEVIGIFGANGSGKTTLLRVVTTLSAPNSGGGRILGATLGTPGVHEVRRRIGLIGHTPAVHPRLTLREHLDLVAALTGSARSAVDGALDAVGLSAAADRLASRCSNGMLRRVEFARVILTRPDVLALDEAHVGLDTAASELVETMVGGVTARGGVTLLVAHERERVAGMIGRAVRLAEGTLHPEGP